LLNTLNENFKSGNIQRVDSLEIGTISGIEHTEEIYKKAIPQFINQNLIRNRRLRVVMDCSYGPVGKISPEILSNLNTDVIALNTTSQNFTAETFPNLDSMRRVVSIIRAAEADLGVIYDADGSRALIFDDTGNLVSSEELGMLFLTYEPALKKTHNSGGAIVASSTVSMVMEQFLESIGIRISRVSNMPGAISRRLREDRGIFGISDTLKFYFPQYGPYSDATYTLMKIIEIIAEQQVSLSSLVRSFPRPIRASKTISGVLTTQKKYGLENLAATSGFVVQDTMDGLKIAKAGAEHTWVLVIPSLHSSVTELISEADERANADEMIRAVELLVKKIVE
jgi:phosphomannomutase